MVARQFNTFVMAKEKLIPRSVDGVIVVTKEELDDYAALFPPQHRNIPQVYTLDGHKLMVKTNGKMRSYGTSH